MNINYLKNYLKSFLLCISSILLLTLLFTTFNYFNWMSTPTMNLIKMFIPIFSLVLGGIYLGSKALKRGWMEGLKLSLLILFFFILLHLLWLKEGFELKNLLYGIILCISTMVGSMIGINVKRKN